jgi:hypothetical protein
MARGSLSLLCLCVFALVLGRNAAEAAQGTSGGAGGFAPGFAIADFDGDQKPDLATVQVERDAAGGTRYSIRLQLSAGEESAIRITGPQGGLELVARDVNGDDVIDLVVTTAMGSHFVAVLINDGHGKFTLAKAGAFPSIESDQGVRLDAAQMQVFSDVDSAYAMVNSNLILLRPYKAKYLQQAVRIRETITFSYQQGGASLLDFLNAENDYGSVQLNYVNLIGSYLTAAAQLNLAVGREAIP